MVANHYLLADVQWTLITGGVLCFPGYLFLAFREAEGAPIRFTPLSFYFLWYTIGLGLSPLYIAYILGQRGSVSFSVAQVAAEHVATAYVFFLVGSVMLHAGLQAARPRRRNHGVAGARQVRLSGALLLVMWVGGLLVLWYPHWVAPFGAPGRLLRWSAVSAVAVLALTEPTRLGLSRFGHAVLLAFGTAGLLVASLMSFSKAYIMFSFFPILWLFLVRRSLHRCLPLLALLMIGVYVGVVAPVVTEARYTLLTEGETPAVRLLSALGERLASGKLEFVPGTIDLEKRGSQLLMRQFDPIPLGFLLGEVDRDGLQWGRTMAYAAYAFVPRLLWPDKPPVTQGAWFAYYVGFAESPETATMSLGITATGELYWNYGLPGVMVGMLFIGLLLGGLWRIAGEDPRSDPLRMLLYVTILFTMPNMSEAVTIVVAIVGTFLTFKTALGVMELLRPIANRRHAPLTA